MMSIKFLAIYGDVGALVEIAKTSGMGEVVYQIYLNRRYVGQLKIREGEWVLLAQKPWMTIDDIQIVAEKIILHWRIGD